MKIRGTCEIAAIINNEVWKGNWKWVRPEVSMDHVRKKAVSMDLFRNIYLPGADYMQTMQGGKCCTHRINMPCPLANKHISGSSSGLFHGIEEPPKKGVPEAVKNSKGHPWPLHNQLPLRLNLERSLWPCHIEPLLRKISKRPPWPRHNLLPLLQNPERSLWPCHSVPLLQQNPKRPAWPLHNLLPLWQNPKRALWSCHSVPMRWKYSIRPPWTRHKLLDYDWSRNGHCGPATAFRCCEKIRKGLRGPATDFYHFDRTLKGHCGPDTACRCCVKIRKGLRGPKTQPTISIICERGGAFWRRSRIILVHFE